MPVVDKTFQVAISPCPNDTFSFYHFLNDAENAGKYQVTFCDIEELNLGMRNGRWDIVKASFPVAVSVGSQYRLLKSGAAIGFGVGPIAIYADESIFSQEEMLVGLPGENTTANFLWHFFVTNSDKLTSIRLRKVYLNFAEVMKKVASKEIDLGVVIHEGRFVYRELGLNLFQDLGKFWHETTGHPVPLGGIFIRSDISPDIRERVETDLKKSISMARSEKKQEHETYKNQILPFIKKHSQELSDEVVEQHIDTYVNSDTEMLSAPAMVAIEYFWKAYNKYLQELGK